MPASVKSTCRAHSEKLMPRSLANVRRASSSSRLIETETARFRDFSAGIRALVSLRLALHRPGGFVSFWAVSGGFSHAPASSVSAAAGAATGGGGSTGGGALS